MNNPGFKGCTARQYRVVHVLREILARGRSARGLEFPVVPQYPQPCILIPLHRGELFGWCIMNR